MDEIKELRDQLIAMKKSLDRYNIINHELITTVMKKRTQGLNWFVNAEIITVPFLILFYYCFCSVLEITMWIPTTIAIACVISTIVDMKTMRISNDRINRSSLQELRQFLVRQKRNRKIQMAVEVPLCFAWILWFMAEYFKSDELFGELKKSDSFIWAEIITTAVALIAFIIIIVVIFIKSQRVNDAMLSDINSLENTEEQ